MRSLTAFAWRNITANRSRSILSIIAVSFGVASTISGNMLAKSMHAAVVKSEDMRTIMEGLVSQMDTMMAIVSAVIMLAAGFLIFNAFTMSITRRRQEIGGLRAVGTTRQQIMRLMMTEALIVGVMGTLIGLVIAPVIANLAMMGIESFSGGMFAFESTSPALWSILLAIGLGIGVTLLSILFPARRAANTPPLDALREPEAEGIDRASRSRTLAGLAILAGLALHLIIAPPGDWVIYPVDANLTFLFLFLLAFALWLLLPVAIEWAGGLVYRLRPNTTGRFISDNLRRGRRRVTLTVVSILFGLAIITGMSGFMSYFVGLFGASMDTSIEQDIVFISHVDPAGGFTAMSNVDTDNILIPMAEYEEIETMLDEVAIVTPNYFIVSPELSFIGDAYFSYVIDFHEMSLMSGMFNFVEGDWDSAIEMMEGGCGVLVSPLVAAKNNAGYGETITVTGPGGTQTDCVIAGIGAGIASASTINLAGGQALGLNDPVMALAIPRIGHTFDEVEAALAPYREAYPDSAITPVQVMANRIEEVTSILSVSLSALLILAVIAAAMGVVNTMMMSIEERRREIGLLRAVGSTRGEVRALLVGEAAMMGVTGGLIGFFGGVAMIAVIIMTYGSNSFGVEVDLWPATFDYIGQSLGPGIVGLIAAPVISGLAAWIPSRRILQEKPVESLALT